MNVKSLSTLNLVCLILLAVFPVTCLTQEGTANVYRLAMPGKSWSLNIPRWALSVGSQRTDGDTTTFSGGREGNKKGKLNPVIFNIRMEPAQATGDAQALSNFSMKKLSKQRTVHGAKQLVYNNIPLIRYSVDINPDFPSPGGSLPGSNIFLAYYVKDDVWITVQLNFLEFKKQDEQFLHSLLDAIKIEELPVN